jgi:hypothetical protein
MGAAAAIRLFFGRGRRQRSAGQWAKEVAAKAAKGAVRYAQENAPRVLKNRDAVAREAYEMLLKNRETHDIEVKNELERRGFRSNELEKMLAMREAVFLLFQAGEVTSWKVLGELFENMKLDKKMYGEILTPDERMGIYEMFHPKRLWIRAKGPHQ